MSDYISREELLKDLYSREYTNFQSRDFIALVQYQDKADVRENIHGEWIAHEVGENIGNYICNYGDYTCSKCGHLIHIPMRAFIKGIKYCENCGANMRKGET